MFLRIHHKFKPLITLTVIEQGKQNKIEFKRKVSNIF